MVHFDFKSNGKVNAEIMGVPAPSNGNLVTCKTLFPINCFTQIVARLKAYG